MGERPRTSRFHAGEVGFHRALGIAERMEDVGQRVIRDFMPDAHRELVTKLPYLFVGAIDGAGRPWASILVGSPGFVESPDARTLVVGARPRADDPVHDALAANAPVGLLSIELPTRRRNRMNGRVVRVREGAFVVAVDQSFGNCPKYIVPRSPDFLPDRAETPHAEAIVARLDARAAALVDRADTFFLATASADAASDGPGEGVDVSHRGGRPGFVERSTASGRTVLGFRDFVGNHLFNSLGNLAVNPRAGLLFVDFETGDRLMLTGTAEVLADPEGVVELHETARFVRFRVDEGRFFESASPGSRARDA